MLLPALVEETDLPQLSIATCGVIVSTGVAEVDGFLIRSAPMCNPADSFTARQTTPSLPLTLRGFVFLLKICRTDPAFMAFEAVCHVDKSLRICKLLIPKMNVENQSILSVSAGGTARWPSSVPRGDGRRAMTCSGRG